MDTTFNNTSDIWFSSSNKINGTNAKSWIMKYNITENTDTVLLTDSFLIGNLLKETINAPIIAFQNITNSYMILKAIHNTNIKNITFVLNLPQSNQNLDYIIRRVFRDLLPIGYNLDVKTFKDFRDFFDEDFNVNYTLKKVA